jgi:hypothetical protein
VITRAHLWSRSIATLIYIYTLLFFKIRFNILSVLSSFKWFFPSNLTKILYISKSQHCVLHMLPISLFFFFLNPVINVWWSIQIMKLLLIWLFLLACCLLPWDESTFVEDIVHIGRGQIHSCACPNSFTLSYVTGMFPSSKAFQHQLHSENLYWRQSVSLTLVWCHNILCICQSSNKN